MKKLIYLVLSVLFAISGIYGIYDTITTPKYDLATSIMTVLLLAFLAWFFWHLFLKPEPRHKHQATNAPESSAGSHLRRSNSGNGTNHSCRHE